MAIDDCETNEQKIIFECLRASVKGPFFDDGEFDTIFGLSREDVQHVIDNWHNDKSSENVILAINNSMNNLLGYPHGKQRYWRDYISVTSEELSRIFAKWRQNSVNSYFDGMM